MSVSASASDKLNVVFITLNMGGYEIGAANIKEKEDDDDKNEDLDSWLNSLNKLTKLKETLTQKLTQLYSTKKPSDAEMNIATEFVNLIKNKILKNKNRSLDNMIFVVGLQESPMELVDDPKYNILDKQQDNSKFFINESPLMKAFYYGVCDMLHNSEFHNYYEVYLPNYGKEGFRGSRLAVFPGKNVELTSVTGNVYYPFIHPSHEYNWKQKVGKGALLLNIGAKLIRKEQTYKFSAINTHLPFKKSETGPQGLNMRMTAMYDIIQYFSGDREYKNISEESKKFGKWYMNQNKLGSDYILMGDLNFRIENDIDLKLSKKLTNVGTIDLSEIINNEKDQLFILLKKDTTEVQIGGGIDYIQNLFLARREHQNIKDNINIYFTLPSGLKEMDFNETNFKPTCKLNLKRTNFQQKILNQNTYKIEKDGKIATVPSWCDRILYHNSNEKQIITPKVYENFDDPLLKQANRIECDSFISTEIMGHQNFHRLAGTEDINNFLDSTNGNYYKRDIIYE